MESSLSTTPNSDAMFVVKSRLFDAANIGQSRNYFETIVHNLYASLRTHFTV